MSRKRLKRMAAMLMAVVLTVCAATPAGYGFDVEQSLLEGNDYDGIT